MVRCLASSLIWAAGQLAGPRQQLPGPDGARGVVGGVDDDGLCALRHRGFQLLQGGQKVRLRVGGDDDGLAARDLDHFGIADPVRRGQNHLVPGVQDGLQGQHDGLLGARGDDDFIRAVPQGFVGKNMVGNGLPQLGNALHIRIAGLACVDGFLGGPADMHRGIKIRLAHAQGDHILALLLQLGHNGVEPQGGGGSNGKRDIGKLQGHRNAPFENAGFHVSPCIIILYAGICNRKNEFILFWEFIFGERGKGDVYFLGSPRKYQRGLRFSPLLLLAFPRKGEGDIWGLLIDPYEFRGEGEDGWV